MIQQPQLLTPCCFFRSPDGRHLAFSVRRDEEDGTRSMLRLWVAPVDSMEARPLVDGLNTVFDSYTWVDNERLCVFTVPPSRGQPPSKPLLPVGPNIQKHEGGENAQSRTFQDLLKDETDERLFEYYATSQLIMVSLGGEVDPIGTPKMYTGVEPSPDSRYLLVAYIEPPFSFTVLCGRFPKRVEVWEAGGGGGVVSEVAYLPLAENIPIASNSTRPGRRSIGWRSDKSSTLWWVETQDGGDAKVEVSPRDIVYSAPAQLGDGEQPQVVAELDLRCSNVLWGHGELALVSESWRKTRQTRTWSIAPDHPQKEKRKVFDRSYEDAYSNPGSPMLRRTSMGTYILASVVDEKGGRERLVLDGQGATPQGDVPFLDLFDV